MPLYKAPDITGKLFWIVLLIAAAWCIFLYIPQSAGLLFLPIAYICANGTWRRNKRLYKTEAEIIKAEPVSRAKSGSGTPYTRILVCYEINGNTYTAYLTVSDYWQMLEPGQRYMIGVNPASPLTPYPLESDTWLWILLSAAAVLYTLFQREIL